MTEISTQCFCTAHGKKESEVGSKADTDPPFFWKAINVVFYTGISCADLQSSV